MSVRFPSTPPLRCKVGFHAWVYLPDPSRPWRIETRCSRCGAYL